KRFCGTGRAVVPRKQEFLYKKALLAYFVNLKETVDYPKTFYFAIRTPELCSVDFIIIPEKAEFRQFIAELAKQER
ncbi:MAG: hypothetical protein IJ598_03655, partial [Ruminococcus sp.]|nr:hypothetical protein [Ruminococcus sp.]